VRAAPLVGILLAAGSSSRFGSAKLMATLPGGAPGEATGVMAEASLRHLFTGVDAVVAVVRPGDDALALLLSRNGARVTVCPDAAQGMGVSLAWAVRAAPVAMGWIVALADMPWIAPSSIARVAEALRAGVPLAAPRFRNSRGHPVGFGAAFYAGLAALQGDEGARRIVEAHTQSLREIDVDDRGVLQDIDTAEDLRTSRG